MLFALHPKTHIMKVVYFVILIVLAGFLAPGCSPVAHVERDPNVNFRQFKTYDWVDMKMAQDDKAEGTAAFARLAVHNAVKNILPQKGLQQSNTNPDILLSYDILVERSVERRSDPVYTQPLQRFFYNPYFGRWSSFYYPSRFMGYDSYTVPVKEATLTISMINTKTDETVWQGWTTQTAHSGQLTSDEIRSSVEAILKKFRP